jgi:hypothetical protein
MATAETEACRIVSATDGMARSDFDRRVKLAQEQLADASSKELRDAADELATVDDSTRSARVADFMAICRSLGWEPPEG